MAEETCIHYWEIEVADGPRSKGVCKYCHAVRYFLNAFPEGRLNPYLEVMETREIWPEKLTLVEV